MKVIYQWKHQQINFMKYSNLLMKNLKMRITQVFVCLALLKRVLKNMTASKNWT